MSQRLTPGEQAPDFTLPDAEGQEVTLSELRGSRVIVYFYPKASTPGCTTQACDFQDRLERFRADGFEVLGISPDKPEKLAKFREDHGLDFTLLSDPSKETLAAWGAFGEKKNYGKTVVGVIRSTFVVDEQGAIALAKYNVKATGHVASLAKQLGIELG